MIIIIDNPPEAAVPRPQFLIKDKDLIKLTFHSPITKGSTCCPVESYQGGRPAVYMVLVWLLKIDSEHVFFVDWLREVVRCLRERGDFWDPLKLAV